MSSESTRLTSEAITLSAAAVLNALISVLGNKGLLSADEEREVYQAAAELIDAASGDDEDGTYELARELIELRMADI
ncbi:hypothetical protein FHX08_001067 [Rhizobium sp. BK529]|uniref:hypothetical protein n=1 Tax=unclassified Rhizobium TaxID=2613769 RepID=UPI0010498193|nr:MULTISPECIES: hypothetical protein [unclassified Rhizobium]MBB3590723.1 hypothetical protein [Rhizobium sp. BK529]TCS05413.1 hypothetical protein EV281_1031096 [Rhizobium sp. BK418]